MVNSSGSQICQLFWNAFFCKNLLKLNFNISPFMKKTPFYSIWTVLQGALQWAPALFWPFVTSHFVAPFAFSNFNFISKPKSKYQKWFKIPQNTVFHGFYLASKDLLSTAKVFLQISPNIHVSCNHTFSN